MATNGLETSHSAEIEHEEHWVAVSDLMGGLMMVFLMIAVVYMVQLEVESRKIKDVAILYDRLRTQLYDDLYQEFKDDLPRWGAELSRDLSMQFYDTEILFARGEDQIRPGFQAILTDFFPRYIDIMTSDKYREDILEIRIEGHTSSDWGDSSDRRLSYIKNMELSQARTRSTVAYLLALSSIQEKQNWLTAHLTANGLSSSKPVMKENGEEDSVRSRRVEFRVRTDSESRIAMILKDM